MKIGKNQYFYIMEFWTERMLNSNNWILGLFLFYLCIILILKLFDPIQFKFFQDFTKYNRYIQRYCIDRNFEIFNIFYLLIIVLISSSLSLLVLFFVHTLNKIGLTLNNYMIIFIISNIFILTRFLIMNIIDKNLGGVHQLKLYYFKNIIFYGYIMIFVMVLLCVLYLNHMISNSLIKLLVLILSIIFSFYHFLIFKNYIDKNPKNFLYLIYYICAFKISPWLWLSTVLYSQY